MAMRCMSCSARRESPSRARASRPLSPQPVRIKLRVSGYIPRKTSERGNVRGRVEDAREFGARAPRACLPEGRRSAHMESCRNLFNSRLKPEMSWKFRYARVERPIGGRTGVRRRGYVYRVLYRAQAILAPMACWGTLTHHACVPSAPQNLAGTMQEVRRNRRHIFNPPPFAPCIAFACAGGNSECRGVVRSIIRVDLGYHDFHRIYFCVG